MKIPFIGDVIGAVKDVVSEVVVDKDKRNELNYKLEELRDRINEREFELSKGQQDINKVEAGHRSLFVAGWRPAVGWVGVFALAYAFVLMPFMSFIARTMMGYEGGFPVINNMNELLVLLFGILGIGGMRTLEKIKGVSSDSMEDSPAASRNVPPGFGTPEELPEYAR